MATLRRAGAGGVPLSEPVADVLRDESQPDLATVVGRDEDTTAVRTALGSLPGRTRRILELRRGLDGREPRSFSAIGREFGLAHTRVRLLAGGSLQGLARHPELRAA